MDLFTPAEPSQLSHEKRPYTDADPDIVRLHVGLTEKQELELVIRQSMQEEEIRQVRELKRVRGADLSNHDSTIEEATRLVEGGQTQPDNGV